MSSTKTGRKRARSPEEQLAVPPAKKPSISHKLIVACDYGTTYTGVSFVMSDKKNIEDISVITTWPGKLSTSWKTPTRIAYKEENDNFQSNKWGFEVEPKHLSYSWTKLLLDKNAAPGDFDDPSLSCLTDESLLNLPNFRSASGVCEDFLREVYKYVFEKFKRQMGEATFNLTPLEVWITLPAIWSDQAKDATLKAAKNAGFGSRVGDEIFTIAESEAAAIATLKAYSEVNVVNAVRSGENILICDCGGGTTDITTYKILKITPQLVFEELCVGIGGKCGATYIDRNLYNLLSIRFGDHYNALPRSQTGPGSRFMASFEKVKRSFGLNDDKSVREVHPLKMEIPDSKNYDSEKRAVILSYTDMQSIFNPVVQGIINLINQQVNAARVKKGAAIDRIILVGGFGDSAYLNQEITKWCQRNGNIQLMCPEHPQAAVVRGAALRGLERIAPKTKLARRHYGFGTSKVFREGIDNEANSFISDFDGSKQCSGRITWTIEKGEAISRDTSGKYPLFYNYTPGTPLLSHINLFTSVVDTAPERDDAVGVEKVGRIVARLPAYFKYGNALKSRYNAKLDRMLYGLQFHVEVVFGNQGDNLTFNALVNGKPHGTTDIEFNTST